MEQESSYINFLKTFINEEVYLFDEIDKKDEVQDINETPESEQNLVMEPSAEEPYSTFLDWQGNQEAQIAFILDEKLPEDAGQRFKKMLFNIGLKGSQVKSAYINGQNLDFEKELAHINAGKLILLSDIEYKNPNLEDYKVSSHNNMLILKAPSFTEIVREKDKVLTFWEALSKFLS